MAGQAWDRDDSVPDLPDLLVSMAACRRRLADAVPEVRPVGSRYHALAAATAAIVLDPDLRPDRSAIVAAR